MNKKNVPILILAAVALTAVGVLSNVFLKRENREPIIITHYPLYEGMSIDDLIAKSDLIVMGWEDTVYPSRWNTSDGNLPNDVTVETISSDMIIFTDISFHISEILKGKIEQSQVRVRTFGGEVKQDRVIVFGQPSLEAGQTYLLFLRPDTGTTSEIEPGHFLVTGAIQGAYQISGDKATSASDEWLLQDLVDYIRKSSP